MKLRTNGPGGAHIGFSMFGARGPLLEGADGSPGAAAAPTTPPNGAPPPAPGTTPAAPAPTPAPPAQQQREKLYTQAEVNRIVADRVKRVKGRQQPARAADPSDDDPNPSNSTVDIEDLHDAIDIVSEEIGVKPSAGLRKRMRAAFRAEAPDDPDTWVRSWFDDAGLKKLTTTPSNTGESNGEPTKPGVITVPVPTTPPISNKGPASGAPREFDSITNPNELTQGDIDRLVAKHGEEKAFQMISALAQRWLKTVRIKIGPNRE